jgi:tryptophan synthase alpha chain
VSAYGVAPVLARCAEQGRAALVAYLPVGYPDVDTSLAAMRTLVECGVDVVEVGAPYSDPLMDGPVIQHAADVALKGGTRFRDAFTAVRAVREAGAPALVMTYWNLVERRGVDATARELADAGGAGLITPDLIPDEAQQWLDASDRNGLDRVFLVAPSSTDARLRDTAGACRGFVYAASTMGVTGVRAEVGSAAQTLVERTRAVTDLPVCVGLGVSTGHQAAEVASFADGVIVGSALVRCLTDATSRTEGLAALARLARELADGVASATRSERAPGAAPC